MASPRTIQRKIADAIIEYSEKGQWAAAKFANTLEHDLSKLIKQVIRRHDKGK